MWAHPLATSFLMLNPKLDRRPLCEGPRPAPVKLSPGGAAGRVCCLHPWLPGREEEGLAHPSSHSHTRQSSTASHLLGEG